MIIISQILVIIATIFIGLSYFSKDKKIIMLLCIIYCIFYGLHYLLLGAFTGFLMTFISSIRNYVFYYNSKHNKNNSYTILIIFVLLAFFSCISTYKDYFSIISMFASILSTYSIWQKNIKKYRVLAIPVSLCFIIYGIHINSIFSIITECILLTLELIGVIDIFIKNSKKYMLNIKMEKSYE